MAETVASTQERTVVPEFRELYGHVERIFDMTAAPDLMSLGPTILDSKSALEDGWLESPDDFMPMLRAATVPAVEIRIGDTTYTTASLFFKKGGNDAADKQWLGDVRFTDGQDELKYKFHTDGRIKLTRRYANSRWISFCWADDKEKIELGDSLVGIKQHLHARKAGQTAVAGSQ